jgi:hypothetical protein
MLHRVAVEVHPNPEVPVRRVNDKEAGEREPVIVVDTEIVPTIFPSASAQKNPSGSVTAKHSASIRPGFQPSAAAH